MASGPFFQRYSRSFLNHVRRGTLVQALGRKLRVLGGGRQKPLSRYNAQTPAEAAQVLAVLADGRCKQHQGVALIIGNAATFIDLVRQEFSARGVPARYLKPEAVNELDGVALKGVSCIVLATVESSVQLELARLLIRNKATAEVPLEYVALPRLENRPVLEWDRYQNGDFVSPELAKRGSALYDLYRKVLERFALKTDIRDFFDLSQLVESVHARGVAGNIAEFGSFKGHSGYLTSQFLELLGSDKTLFMFDMFENFPEEGVGVDAFWSGTHKVDFAEVSGKFRDCSNVRLIKGDFTGTLPQTDTGQLALAFIDCDSYRATRFLLEYLWDHRISVGGIVAMEDYGHAALLGNRVAVHDFFDGRRDAYTYFSQFSGFFVAVKLGS